MDTTEVKYIDIPIAGNSKDGSVINNNEALDNAFRLWVTASKNEFLRKKGGNVLAKHIGKPMNDDRAIAIKRDIQAGVVDEFNPPLTVLKLTVTPDYVKRRYSILLVAYSEQLRVGINQTYLVDNE